MPPSSGPSSRESAAYGISLSASWPSARITRNASLSRIGEHRVEQSGLADARVAADRQRPRRAAGRVRERRP